MRFLPRPIDTVEVPLYVSPSALGSWGTCILKLVVSNPSVKVDRLPSGPDAAIGTLVHRVLERWGRGEGPDDPNALFELEYEQTRDALRSDPNRSHFADLLGTRAPHEWVRLRAWVVERCRTLRRPAAPPAAREDGRPSPAIGSGPERRLVSDGLRLKGRADRIQRLAPSSYEIRDFKTGNVVTADDEIKPEIRLQLHAYALILKEKDPRAHVRLVVDDGEEREVPFDRGAREAAMAELESIVSQIPPPGHAAARELAAPGPGCFGCSIRHVCPAYRGTAPSWWQRYPPELDRACIDTWGQLLDVRTSQHVTDTVDAVLQDEAGRRVRIDGIDPRHGLSNAMVGTRLAMFQLEATGHTRGFDGQRYHPRCFHELPRDARERRAWSTASFAVEQAPPPHVEDAERPRT